MNLQYIILAPLILLITCQKAQSRMQCSENEKIIACCSDCEPTCDKPILNPNMVYTLGCASCACREGYAREKAGGKCILLDKCSRCSINEIRNDCASPCLPEPTCQNPNPKPDPDRGCVAVCLPRCDCDNGFIRDGITRKCVRLNNCPSSVKY